MGHFLSPVRPSRAVNSRKATREKTAAQLAHEALQAATLGQTDALCDSLIACDQALHRGDRPKAADIVPLLIGAFDPVGKASALAATAMLDATPGAATVHFHNIRHFLSVAIATLGYATVERDAPSLPGTALDDAWRADCFDVALLHDIGHPGGDNRGEPLRLEMESWLLAQSLFIGAGHVGGSRRMTRMRDAMLMTEPNFGRPIAWQLAQYHAATDQAGRDEALAALDAHRQANGENPALQRKEPTPGNLNLMIDQMIQRGLSDPAGAMMTMIVNRADVFGSMMPETYPRATVDLHDEYDAVGGMKLVCDKRRPIPGCGTYFLTKIAHAAVPHPLGHFRAIEQGRPQETLMALQAGLFNDPAYPANFAGPTRRPPGLHA